MTMTFHSLLRRYRLYESLALYDAYYERMANLGEKGAHLGDALPIAWVPLVFHCTYFKHLDSILKSRELRPGCGKDYVALTELTVTELTRFQSLRTEPFDIAIGFPRVSLERKGLFQPAYLKHASHEVKDRFRDALHGYVELDDDLGALHEVRVPGSLSLNDAVWVLSAKRNNETRNLDLEELKPIRDLGIAISFWHPSHQEGLIREAVFRKVTRDSDGMLVSFESVGRHYFNQHAEASQGQVSPPTGKAFSLRFPRELRSDSIQNGWEGPFSKYEMAEFCFNEMKSRFAEQLRDVPLRIRFDDGRRHQRG